MGSLTAQPEVQADYLFLQWAQNLQELRYSISIHGHLDCRISDCTANQPKKIGGAPTSRREWVAANAWRITPGAERLRNGVGRLSSRLYRAIHFHLSATATNNNQR
jgi:hypothetical protein